MVSIEIQRNSDGQVVGCHMSGHAGYDEHGFDIVCAQCLPYRQRQC